ncbi:MAG: mechanosensitive ion channel family protein [Stenotrophomonas sp.]
MTTAPASLPDSLWAHALSGPRLLETYGLTLASALAVMLIGLWVARRMANAVPRATARVGVDPMLGNFLRNVTYAASVVIVVVLSIATLGVPVSPLLAVLGTAGLAVCLALKDSLSNIASGVMLVTLRPFRVGDMVNIAGQLGTVREVRIFQTVIVGTDNQHTTIPNTLITAAPIINLTAAASRRIELTVGIGYGDNIQLARDTALTAIHADPRVLAEPAADVVVYALGDHAIELGIRCHVKPTDFVSTRTSLLEQIKLGFDGAGISIPYPQQDTHVYLHRTGTRLAADIHGQRGTPASAAARAG